MGLPSAARLTALGALLLLPTAVPSVAPARPSAPAVVAGATIDPDLLRQVAAGPVPAILTWDDEEAGRAEVVSFLEAGGYGYHLLRSFPMAFACVGSAGRVAELSRAPGAISVWGDELMTPALDASVPAAFNGNPNAVWSGDGITGDGVGIAVVDTGIDATHPDLRYGTRTKANVQVVYSHNGNLGTRNGFCTIPNQYMEGLEDSETTSGHGTHIASVAAGDGTASGGKYRGMAPGATLYGFNVLETATPDRHYNEREGVSLLRVAGAIDWITWNVENVPAMPKVMLMGWDSPGLHEPDHPLYALLMDNIDYYGISIVFPAGNRGPAPSRCDRQETCYFNSMAPGLPIAVGASLGTSRRHLADFSSRGDPIPRETGDRLTEYRPTLVAPGTNVTAAKRLGLVGVGAFPSDRPLGASGAKSRSALDMSYQSLTGTSVAAAHVAGAVALMQEASLDAKGCYLSPEQVKRILQETATPMPGYEAWEVGAGALDATAAVWAARFAPVSDPLQWWICPQTD